MILIKIFLVESMILNVVFYFVSSMLLYNKFFVMSDINLKFFRHVRFRIESFLSSQILN